MKPAPFAYVAVRSVEEALAQLDEGAWVLAGGQSLVPLMNFREARPPKLVDINPIAELGVIRRTQGVLRIGATVRQAALERSPLVREHWPLLAHAVRHVGHPGTRSRGTVGGSVAFADPRAELPLALRALDATLVTTRRRLPVGPLEPWELLTAIEVPPLAPGTPCAFREFARTEGDFAQAAVAVVGSRVVATEAAGEHERALVAELTRQALAEAA